MEKANIKVINWEYSVAWSDYAKLIKNVSYTLAEKIAKEAFEKYSSIMIDGNDGSLIMGKSRITEYWIALDTIRNYIYNPNVNKS